MGLVTSADQSTPSDETSRPSLRRVLCRCGPSTGAGERAGFRRARWHGTPGSRPSRSSGWGTLDVGAYRNSRSLGLARRGGLGMTIRVLGYRVTRLFCSDLESKQSGRRGSWHGTLRCFRDRLDTFLPRVPPAGCDPPQCPCVSEAL